MPALACLAGLVWLLIAALPRVASAQDAAPEAPRFDVLEFVIEGNTVLDVTAIEQAVTPFLGPGRSLDDVEHARSALEKAYQSAGWLSVVVDIPEQRVDAGEVRLRVLEGRVERLSVTGARYVDQGMIRRRVPELAAGKVPNFERVQAQLAAASRDDRRLQPVLRPGSAPGTVDAELKVEDRAPWGGSVELHNDHADDTDPWRLHASFRYANLWQRDHALSLTAITAPREPSQSQVLVASYAWPMDDGWSGSAYAVWSDSVVEPVGATVFGQGFTLGLRAQYAFAYGSGYHSVSLGADFKDLKERLQFGDDSLSTPLRYLPLQVAWTGTWPEARRLTTLSAQWTTAFRGILQRDVECPGDVGPVDQFACKRQGGDGGFTHLRLDLRHQRPAPWDGWGRWSLRLQAQLATQPLVSAEQFAVGGADSVRGYLQAEASGDRGVLGSAEWEGPDLLAPAKAGDGGDDGGGMRWLHALLPVAFVDVARVWVVDPAPGQFPRRSLAGAGFGLRVRAAGGLAAEADIAWPGKSAPATASGDPRLHLRMQAQF